MKSWVWKGAVDAKSDEGGRKALAGLALNRYRKVFGHAVLLVGVLLIQSCAKEEAPVSSAPESEFKFHIYVVPGAEEKDANNLELMIYVDGQRFRYESGSNEIVHTMKLRVPGKVPVSFQANSQLPATFHFRAYQDELPVWGGGSGCRSNTYAKKDELYLNH